MGGTLAIFLSPYQLQSQILTYWLDRLSLRAMPTRSMAFAEFPNPVLEDRFSSYPARLLGYRAVALESSHFAQGEDHGVAQIFYLRASSSDPSSPRGKLAISFSVQQFSDAAVGDVWDGTIPSSIARLRESQFAHIVAAPKQFTFSPVNPTTEPTMSDNVALPVFLILKRGKTLMEGTLTNRISKPRRRDISLGLYPDEYLIDLQRRALMFVKQHCKTLDKNGFCANNFFGRDYVEWSITFKTDERGVTALELVHDSKLSGLSSNYNVIFLRK
jgi:hypothetical protein